MHTCHCEHVFLRPTENQRSAEGLQHNGAAESSSAPVCTPTSRRSRAWAGAAALECCVPLIEKMKKEPVTLCAQHFGTLRPGADTGSKGCRGNHRPPSPRRWIGAGRLHQVGPHDLCHRPADKQSRLQTGTPQVGAQIHHE